MKKTVAVAQQWLRRSGRAPLSDTTNSPAASSEKSSKSAMSGAQMTGSPSKIPITNADLTKPATYSDLNVVALQVNLLVESSEAHTKRLAAIEKKLGSLEAVLKAVAEKIGVPADCLDDPPDADNLAEKFNNVKVV